MRKQTFKDCNLPVGVNSFTLQVSLLLVFYRLGKNLFSIPAAPPVANFHYASSPSHQDRIPQMTSLDPWPYCRSGLIWVSSWHLAGRPKCIRLLESEFPNLCLLPRLVCLPFTLIIIQSLYCSTLLGSFNGRRGVLIGQSKSRFKFTF